MRPALRFLLGLALDLAALSLIVAGVALIYTPAAFITAGLALVAVSWASRPDSETETPE